MPTLFTWLRRGWITGRQDTRPPYRWIITANQADVTRLRALHQLPAGYHNRRRWLDETPPDQARKETMKMEAATHAEALRSSY